MTVRRTAAGIAALGIAPLTLTLVTAGPAAAHGSMTDPVSRVSACFAEGPENPQSAACKAAVQASGTQAFYDWNEVNIPDAAGKHKEIIPDGKLCSAGRDKYKGLDLPRADWPATGMSAGTQEFTYRATAPHRGGFALYITKDGYDPSKPLKWSDLESEPFATAENPELKDGSYILRADVPEKSGRHLIYSIWQRSDSPEAFYTCSDVTFGGSTGAGAGADGGEASTGGDGDTGTGAAPAAEAPDEAQIASGAGKSTVAHDGHGAGHQDRDGTGHAADGVRPDGGTQPDGDAQPDGGTQPEAAGKTELAETGGEATTLAAGGAAVLAAGAGVVLATLRRRSPGRHRG